MPITTRKGDKGKTSLLCGRKVKKDDLTIEACGTVDELASFLGLAKSLSRDKTGKKLIDRIQRELSVICSEISAGPSCACKLRKRIGQKNIKYLDSAICRFEKKHKFRKRGFTIPGRSAVSAVLDVTRTITRRAERRIITLTHKKMISNNNILIYLNRLSDLLYLMTLARDRAAANR